MVAIRTYTMIIIMYTFGHRLHTLNVLNRLRIGKDDFMKVTVWFYYTNISCYAHAGLLSLEDMEKLHLCIMYTQFYTCTQESI